MSLRCAALAGLVAMAQGQLSEPGTGYCDDTNDDGDTTTDDVIVCREGFTVRTDTPCVPEGCDPQTCCEQVQTPGGPAFCGDTNGDNNFDDPFDCGGNSVRTDTQCVPEGCDAQTCCETTGAPTLYCDDTNGDGDATTDDVIVCGEGFTVLVDTPCVPEGCDPHTCCETTGAPTLYCDDTNGDGDTTTDDVIGCGKDTVRTDTQCVPEGCDAQTCCETTGGAAFCDTHDDQGACEADTDCAWDYGGWFCADASNDCMDASALNYGEAGDCTFCYSAHDQTGCEGHHWCRWVASGDGHGGGTGGGTGLGRRTEELNDPTELCPTEYQACMDDDTCRSLVEAVDQEQCPSNPLCAALNTCMGGAGGGDQGSGGQCMSGFDRCYMEHDNCVNSEACRPLIADGQPTREDCDTNAECRDLMACMEAGCTDVMAFNYGEAGDCTYCGSVYDQTECTEQASCEWEGHGDGHGYCDSLFSKCYTDYDTCVNSEACRPLIADGLPAREDCDQDAECSALMTCMEAGCTDYTALNYGTAEDCRYCWSLYDQTECDEQSSCSWREDEWSGGYCQMVAACPARATLSDTGNTYIDFQSGRDPNDQSLNNQNCLWVMTCSDSSQVPVLQFYNIETEAQYDFVRVYDGDGTSTPTHSWHGTPNQFFRRDGVSEENVLVTTTTSVCTPDWDPGWGACPEYQAAFTATSSTAAIRYQSDGSANRLGFAASFFCMSVSEADDSCDVANPDYGPRNGYCDYSDQLVAAGQCDAGNQCCPVGTDCTDCGDCPDLTTEDLTFSSTIACDSDAGSTVTDGGAIGFAQNSSYTADARCLWVVDCSSMPGTLAQVTFLNINTEANYDYVYVLNDVGNKDDAVQALGSSSWSLSGSYDDAYFNDQPPVKGASAQLAVFLTSDETEQAAGFQAVAQCVPVVSACDRYDACCLCRETSSREDCASTCGEIAEGLVRASCAAPAESCDAVSGCYAEIAASLTVGPRPRLFNSAAAEDVWNCIEGLGQDFACAPTPGYGTELTLTSGCGLDTSYACTTSCCDCHSACRVHGGHDTHFFCEAECELVMCDHCAGNAYPACCECNLMCDAYRPDSRNGRVPTESEEVSYIACLSACAVGDCYEQNVAECNGDDCCRAELDCQVDCSPGGSRNPIDGPEVNFFACQNDCLQAKRVESPGLCGDQQSLCQRCESQCEADLNGFYCNDPAKYLGVAVNGVCDERLCKQYCQCVQCTGEGNWNPDSCNACPYKKCAATDECGADSMCYGKITGAVGVSATSVDELRASTSFAQAFKQWVSAIASTTPDKVIIDWDATSRQDGGVGRRRLQVSIAVHFEIRIPTEEAADRADNLATEALRARQTGETATIAGFVAYTSTMESAVSWSQFINPYSILRLATDEPDGPGSKYCDGQPHVLPVGSRASSPGYVFQRYEKSFLRLEAGSVAGATITLQTCNSKTTVGANTVPAMTSLTTFKPSYITERGGINEIDVMLARNDPDVVVSQENYPDAPVACAIEGDDIDDSMLSQIQAQSCSCPSGSYTPAVLREDLEAETDSISDTLLRVECASPEGCTKLEVTIICLMQADCDDPSSISQRFAYGAWQNENGELEALRNMATSTTADVNQVVELVNTGVLVLEVDPPAGLDKPEWVTVEVVENNRPVAFTATRNIAPGDAVRFMLTFSGGKKSTGQSEDVETVFFPTRGGGECSEKEDRQGNLREGLTLTVDLVTRKVALTAIAIPSVVEVELKAGTTDDSTVTLYNVMSTWATWVVRGCATDDICTRVANGQCDGPPVPQWLQVQPFVDPSSQEEEFNPSSVNWGTREALAANTDGLACTDQNLAGCAISGEQTQLAASWRSTVAADKCANVWPPSANSDELRLRLATEGATAPGEDEYCGGETADFTPACDESPYTDRWLPSPAACPAGCDRVEQHTPRCDLNPATDGTAQCPAGCVHDSAAQTCTGTATVVAASCTGTATAVPRACVFERAYRPICDLDAWTDNSAECPAGCAYVAQQTPVCDLDPATDGTALCPAGCVHNRAQQTCTGTATVVAASCTGTATEIPKTCRSGCTRYPATTKTHQAGTYYFELDVLAGPYPRFGTQPPEDAWEGPAMDNPSRTCSKVDGCDFTLTTPPEVSWATAMDENTPDGCERNPESGAARCAYGAPYLSNIEANTWSVGVTLVVVPEAPDVKKVTVGISHASQLLTSRLKANQAFSGTVNLVDRYLNLIDDPSYATNFRVQCDACKWAASDMRSCVGVATTVTCDLDPATNPEFRNNCPTDLDCTFTNSSAANSQPRCTGSATARQCAYTDAAAFTGCTPGCVDAPPSAKVKYGSYLKVSSTGESTTAVGFYASLTAFHGGAGYTGSLIYTPYQLKLLQKNPVCTGTARAPAGGGKTPTCDLDPSTDGTAECPDGCTQSNADTTRAAYSSISAEPYSPTCDLDFSTDGIAACPEGCVFSEASGAVGPSCTAPAGASGGNEVTPVHTKNFEVHAVTCTGENRPNDCNAEELTKGTCVIGSKCVCQIGQGKENPAAPCEKCAPGKYTDRESDLPCMQCPAGKVTNGTDTSFCEDCPAGKSSPDSLPGGSMCVDCKRNEYSSTSVLSQRKCVSCPAGTETVGPGYPVCNCKVDHYFDDVGLTGGQKSNFYENNGRFPTWEDAGCVDCTKLLPQEKDHTYKCQGGPKGLEASWRALASAKAERGAWTPVGPAIAAEGWYLVSRECDVGTKEDPDIKTCFTSHPCSGDACYGIANVVAKEYNDMLDEDNVRYSEYPKTGYDEPEFSPSGFPNKNKTATRWCKMLHELAHDAENIPLDDLKISREDPDTKEITHSFMYEVDGCADKYITAIVRAREYLGYGVRNFCHVGHEGERCASCSVVNGHQLEKGDDGLCHYCKDYSLWILTRGDLATCFLYQIPYNLFLRSGRPEALKSAMFASFMFFIQTVTLLGQDSGYFMGKAEGAKEVAGIVETGSRIFSVSLEASITPVAVNASVAPEEVCPGMADTYFTVAGSLSPFTMFIKQAIFKSVILLGGVTVWHHGIFWLFVYCRLQYYIGRVLHCITGGRACRLLKWQWSAEVKVLYQDSVETTNTVTGKKESSFQPVLDVVVQGPGAIMLNFHTCGILLSQARDIQKGREQAMKVRARAKFKKADADHGGTLDKTELLELLTSMGNKMTEKDVEEIVNKAAKKRPAGVEVRDFSDDSQKGRMRPLEKDEMSEDEFVDWFLNQTFKAARPFCGSQKYHCGACYADPAAFRPNGSVRGECVVSSVGEAPKVESLSSSARLEDGPYGETQMGIPDYWFQGDEEAKVNTKEEFLKMFAAIIPEESKGHKAVSGDDASIMWEKLRQSGHTGEETAPITKPMGENLPVHKSEASHHSRVRIDQLDPLGASSLLVSFTVLPEDYHNEQTSENQREKHMLDPTQPTYDPVKYHGQYSKDRCWRKRKEHIKRDAQAGMDIRTSLSAAFTDRLVLGDPKFHSDPKFHVKEQDAEVHVVPEQQRHEASGLTLEILVDLKDMKNGARFWRAVYMLSATVLYYPVIQATLPMLQCYRYVTQEMWDTCVLDVETGACIPTMRRLDEEFVEEQRTLCSTVRGTGYEVLAARANSTWIDSDATALAALSFIGHGPQSGADVDYSDPSQSCLFGLGKCLEVLDSREEEQWGDHEGFRAAAPASDVEECLEQYAECRTCGDDVHLYCVWDEGLVWLGTPKGDCRFAYDLEFLDAEQSITCTGQQWWISTILAYVILGCCVALPIFAFFQIRESKHAAKELALAEAAAEGRPIKEEKKRAFCENIFLGQHHTPSRRSAKLFEDRILRDQYSSLYAMCEQRAYYWFIVDLMRKAAISAIYMFGRNGRFDYQYILLVFFVFFAINHDIAQPYRGRAENLFAFLTLMFIIVLVHTSTMANLGSGGGLISISFITMVSIVFLTLVMFCLAMFYNKRNEREHAVAAERRSRRAQDHWGDIAKDMLGLDADDSTEEALRAAFKVFDDGNDRHDGTLTCNELMNLRDRQRRLYQTWVPHSCRRDRQGKIVRVKGHGEVGWESTPEELEQASLATCTCVRHPEDRKPKEDPGQLLAHEPDCDKCKFLKPKVSPGGLPQTRRLELFEDITDEECEEMITEADIDGDNRISFDEFVSVIFNSWERKQQTDKLAEWVFTEFHRPVKADYEQAPTKCCRKEKVDKWEPHLDICKPKKKKVYKSKNGGDDVIVKAGLWPRYKEYMLQQMSELNPMVDDLDLFKGMLESVSLRPKYSDGWEAHQTGPLLDGNGQEVKDQEVDYVAPEPFKVDLKTGLVTFLCDGKPVGLTSVMTFSNGEKQWKEVPRDTHHIRARRNSLTTPRGSTVDMKPEPDFESQAVETKDETQSETESEHLATESEQEMESLTPAQEPVADSEPRP